ncbi:MAG: 2-oxoacid:acceptor oxidoreductase family protein [Promethearchaeota archaeon]
MVRKEIRIAGFGGQGIITSAKIIGKAAGIYANKESCVMEVYGPESRGGAASGTIVVGDDKTDTDYPYVTNPEFQIMMSQAAYLKYKYEITPETTLIVDESLVTLDEDLKVKKIMQIPATRFAEEMGKRIVANVIMLGYVASVTNIVPPEAMKEAILKTVKKQFVALNDKAFDKGFNFGEKMKKEGKN